eukprot:5971559-Prymnesium_polylepis.1
MSTPLPAAAAAPPLPPPLAAATLGRRALGRRALDLHLAPLQLRVLAHGVSMMPRAMSRGRSSAKNFISAASK